MLYMQTSFPVELTGGLGGPACKGWDMTQALRSLQEGAVTLVYFGLTAESTAAEGVAFVASFDLHVEGRDPMMFS